MMYSVSLCADVFDPEGDVLLPAVASSDIGSMTRRITRTATLDGGASLEDLGHCPGDMTLRVVFKLASTELDQKVKRLISIYPLLTLATQHGCWRGAVDDYKPAGATATLQFLVQTQLDT